MSQKVAYFRVLYLQKVAKKIREYTNTYDWKQKYNKRKRIKRGLFKTNSGKIINADINGALNVLRKYIKEIFYPNLEIVIYPSRTTTHK